MRVNLRGKVSHRRGRLWPSQKRSLLRQGRDAPRGARYPGPRRMVRRGPRYYAHGETCALVWRDRRAHRHGPVLRGYRTPSVFRIRYPVSLSGPGPSSRESAGRSAGAAPVPGRRPSHPDLPHPAARGERTRAPPRVRGAGPARGVPAMRVPPGHRHPLRLARGVHIRTERTFLCRWRGAGGGRARGDDEMAKATPRKGMQLFDADEALLGMIAGARGGTIVVDGRHIPKGAVARVTQNRAYLKPGADWAGEAHAGTPAASAAGPVRPPRRAVRAPRRVRCGRCPGSRRTRPWHRRPWCPWPPSASGRRNARPTRARCANLVKG